MNTLKSCPLMEPNFWEEMSCNSHNVVADCPHRKPNSDLENSRWTCASCGAKYSHNHKRVTVQRECGTVTVCCACEGAEMEKDIEIERLKIALEAVKNADSFERAFEIACKALKNSEVTAGEGYDYIAGVDIKQDQFVYVSKNGKIYPYNKLAHETKEEEVLVNDEPTYPKNARKTTKQSCPSTKR